MIIRLSNILANFVSTILGKTTTVIITLFLNFAFSYFLILERYLELLANIVLTVLGKIIIITQSLNIIVLCYRYNEYRASNIY